MLYRVGSPVRDVDRVGCQAFEEEPARQPSGRTTTRGPRFHGDHGKSG